MGVSDGTKPNVYGEKPWINDNPLTPNEAYFRNVDAVVKAAARGESDHPVDHVPSELAQVHHGGERAGLGEMGFGALQERAEYGLDDEPAGESGVRPGHPRAGGRVAGRRRRPPPDQREAGPLAFLVQFRPPGSPCSISTRCRPGNDVQLIYPMVTKDYQLKPVKPVLMAEGAYEAGSEYGFEVTPLWVRRQAYYSYLAGAHHTYGHNDSWRILPSWKSALDAPGAQQMGLLRKVFEARQEWWLLDARSIRLRRRRTDRRASCFTWRRAIRAAVGMLYLADKAEFTVDLGKLSGAKVRGFWFNPKSGEQTAIEPLTNKGMKAFSTPEGWERLWPGNDLTRARR